MNPGPVFHSMEHNSGSSGVRKNLPSQDDNFIHLLTDLQG